MALDLARLPLVRGVHTCQEFRLQAATVSCSPVVFLASSKKLTNVQFIQLLTEDSSLGDK